MATASTSLQILEDVVEIMNKVQMVSANTTYCYVSEASLQVKDSEDQIVGTITVTEDGDAYLFTASTQ